MDFASRLFLLTQKFGTVLSDRYLNPFFIRFTAITIILITIISLVIAFWTSAEGLNIYGSWTGGDYSCFYVAGKILNDYSPSKLYDFSLHSELLHSLLPNISLDKQLPYMNPPFFALIFKPLSCLPFMISYFIWILISVAMYTFGFAVFWKTLDSMPLKTFGIAILLALSYEPFLIETVLGGNSSAVGFFAYALFLYFRHLKNDLLSGFSLGILLYKPTFLIIILPMVLIARRARILLGFTICCIIFFFLSAQTVGLETCIKYMRLLIGFSTMASGPEEIYRTWKYVDIFSFSRLLFGTISPTIFISIILASLAPVIFSIKMWWKLNSLNKSCQEMLIASSITFTIIINLHFGMYDTVILVLSILLSINVLNRDCTNQYPSDCTSGFTILLVSIFVFPWISQHVARITGIQLFTLVIVIIGGYQVLLTRIYSKIT
jgi:hypothetical protein